MVNFLYLHASSCSHHVQFLLFKGVYHKYAVSLLLLRPLLKDRKKGDGLRFYRPKFSYIFCDMDGKVYLLNNP